jgi:hypothetical protein
MLSFYVFISMKSICSWISFFAFYRPIHTSDF